MNFDNFVMYFDGIRCFLNSKNEILQNAGPPHLLENKWLSTKCLLENIGSKKTLFLYKVGGSGINFLYILKVEKAFVQRVNPPPKVEEIRTPI